MITCRYIKSKRLYVFSKQGVYWALAPEQLQEMEEICASTRNLQATYDSNGYLVTTGAPALGNDVDTEA